MNWSYLALPLAAALCAPGCCSTRADEPMDLHSIERGAHSAIDARGLRIARDAAAWQALWSEHTANRLPAPALPKVDFAEHMVAFVSAGSKPSAGFGVVVRALVPSDAGWVLEVEESKPAPDRLHAMVVTQPYEFVRVKQYDGEISVRFEPAD